MHLPARIWRKLNREISEISHRIVDKRECTYTFFSGAEREKLRHCASQIPLEKFAASADQVSEIVANTMAHRFNLLGSGFIQVRHDIACNGVEGHRYSSAGSVQVDSRGQWLVGRINDRNLDHARELWCLIDPAYVPIDWHLDFKSGYRWNESTWYRDIRWGHQPGCDVKVPWELARMQHLPQLAIAFRLAKSGLRGFLHPTSYAREFRNQILDFVATNPPRFGVNWACTMDVAIRIANILTTYDLFCDSGAAFDDAFQTVLFRSVYEHGLHISGNLEKVASGNNNHLLANLVGLQFVAAYLPETPVTKTWSSTVRKELMPEIERQFYSDGSNFEGSTSYHRLSSEIVAYSAALHISTARANAEPIENVLPEWYCDRLWAMASFTSQIMRTDGTVPQIGDNDSGRFIALLGTAPATACGQGHGPDHRDLLAVIGAVLGDDDLPSNPTTAAAAAYAAGLVRGTPICKKRTALSPHTVPAAYPRFGLYIYKQPGLHLAIRCGPVGCCGQGGHSHNDQLSFELAIRERPVFVDTGTYLYTASPKMRNYFRSTAAHNTLTVEHSEQYGPLLSGKGLFRLTEKANGRALIAKETEFCGEHLGYEKPHRRCLFLGNDKLAGRDSCAAKCLKRLHFHVPMDFAIVINNSTRSVELRSTYLQLSGTADRGFWELQTEWYSPRYGEKTPIHRLSLATNDSEVNWEFRW